MEWPVLDRAGRSIALQGAGLMGLARRYREWIGRADQSVTRRKGATWQREFDERMLGRHRRLLGERAFPIINGKYLLSHRLRAEGRYEEALDLLEQVLVQRAERYGPDHRKSRETKLALAVTLSKLGRAEEARGVLSDLISTCVRLQGDADNETQQCRLWLASVLVDLGSYAPAQDELTKIVEVARWRGGWWDSDAEARTKDYWRIVTSEEFPD